MKPKELIGKVLPGLIADLQFWTTENTIRENVREQLVILMSDGGWEDELSQDLFESYNLTPTSVIQYDWTKPAKAKF